jgi:hypothetical protein
VFIILISLVCFFVLRSRQQKISPCPKISLQNNSKLFLIHRNTNENGCFKIKIIIEKATSGPLDSGPGAELEHAELVSASSHSEGACRPPA